VTTPTQEDVIRMAREAGIFVADCLQTIATCKTDLERFAALVAAAEREACAKVCDDNNTAMADKLAAAIRARGNQ